MSPSGGEVSLSKGGGGEVSLSKGGGERCPFQRGGGRDVPLNHHFFLNPKLRLLYHLLKYPF